MKNAFLILLAFMLNFISCKAQNIISLEDAALYPEQADGRTLPLNITYVKDVNNSLNKYVGTWSGSYDNKIYEFNFIKQINHGSADGSVRRDRLIGRLKVKNSSGNIIYNSLNESDDLKTKFKGDKLQSDLQAYIMYFQGNTIGCAEYGAVSLRIKPATPNQMTVFMIPDNDTTVEGMCPPNFQPTIPYLKTIYLIKQ